MKKFFKLAKEHWQIIILAAIISIIVIRPLLSSINKIGFDNFKGIYPMFSDDEDYYLAKARDVFDGHSNVGNIYFKEHKDAPFMNSMLGELVLGKVAKYLNVSVPFVFAVCDVVFPFVTVILIYILLFRITGKKTVAYLFAFFCSLLVVTKIARPINLQLCLPLFLLGLIVAWEIFRGSNIKRNLLFNSMMGIIFGLLLFMYPFMWTALIVVYVLCLLFRFISEKDFKFLLRSLLSFLVFSSVFIIFYVINTLAAKADINYLETTLRMGMIYNNHWPGAFHNAGVAILAMIPLFLARKRFTNVKSFNFSLLLLLTLVIISWQNVITGTYMMFSTHYLHITYVLIVIVIGIVTAFTVDSFKGASRKIIMPSLIILGGFMLLAFFVKSQYVYVQDVVLAGQSRETLAEYQSAAPVFDWFNKNSPRESVIYILNDYEKLYSIYTYNNVYYNEFGGAFLLPDSEMEDRWVRQNIFNPKADREYAIASQWGIWTQKFLDSYQNRENRIRLIAKLIGKPYFPAEQYPAEYLDRLMEKYARVKKEDLVQTLKKFEIDYLVLGPSDNNLEITSELAKYNQIQLVTEINGRKIYKID